MCLCDYIHFSICCAAKVTLNQGQQICALGKYKVGHEHSIPFMFSFFCLSLISKRINNAVNADALRRKWAATRCLTSEHRTPTHEQRTQKKEKNVTLPCNEWDSLYAMSSNWGDVNMDFPRYSVRITRRRLVCTWTSGWMGTCSVHVRNMSERKTP